MACPLQLLENALIAAVRYNAKRNPGRSQPGPGVRAGGDARTDHGGQRPSAPPAAWAVGPRVGSATAGHVTRSLLRLVECCKPFLQTPAILPPPGPAGMAPASLPRVVPQGKGPASGAIGLRRHASSPLDRCLVVSHFQDLRPLRARFPQNYPRGCLPRLNRLGAGTTRQHVACTLAPRIPVALVVALLAAVHLVRRRLTDRGDEGKESAVQEVPAGGAEKAGDRLRRREPDRGSDPRLNEPVISDCIKGRNPLPRTLQ